MSVARVLTEEMIQGKPVRAGEEKEPISIARGEREGFLKWVSAHEEDVKGILCTSLKFSREPFCGLRYRSQLAGTFSRSGVAQ